MHTTAIGHAIYYIANPTVDIIYIAKVKVNCIHCMDCIGIFIATHVYKTNITDMGFCNGCNNMKVN